MKLILLSLVLGLWSAFSHAETPEINARQVTCKELEDFVAQYKDVDVIHKGIFRMKVTNVTLDERECSSDEKTIVWAFKTRDVRNCEVGKYCKQRIRVVFDSGYSGGGSWDSGPSTSSGSSWGSNDNNHDDNDSSSGSSSYNPPSSDYRGPSYNPPSSNDHGPSYNPPERGTRGPRYCPTC